METIDLNTAISLASAIVGPLGIDELPQLVVRLAQEKAHASLACLMLTIAGSDELAPNIYLSNGSAILQRPQREFAIPESVVSLVKSKRSAIVLGSSLAPPSGDLLEYWHERGKQAITIIPLLSDGHILGLLYLERKDAFDTAALTVLAFLSSLAAGAISNAHRRAELERNQSRMRSVLSTNIMGIVIWERGGKILEANEAFLKIVGYEGNPAALPRSLETLTPDEWKPAIARREAQFSGGGVLPPFEREFFRQDGSRVPVLVTATKLDDAAVQRVTFVLDITERKRTEEALHSVKAELEHASRVTELTVFTGSIAHEINQPLSAIVTNGSAGLRWLNRPEPNIEEVRESLQRMVLDGHRASAVISGIRSLLKRRPGRSEVIDLHVLIEKSVLLFQHEASEPKVRIDLHLRAKNSIVAGNNIQLQQLLGNLLANGMEAMYHLEPNARVLSISSRHTKGMIEVSVMDRGQALDPVVCDRLFEPFFTTKEEGLGMGLNICKLIVDAHGGKIWAAHDEHNQTAFRFSLPVTVSQDLDADTFL